jgi:D-aminopeptidase
MDNGSGDYVIAFSTNPAVRRRSGLVVATPRELSNEAMTGLFQAVVEATEEAVYNSLLKATSVTSRFATVEALPVKEVLAILQARRAVGTERSQPH